MDTNDLVAVYTVANPVKAEIIKNALAGEGIRCFIEGENQAGIGYEIMSSLAVAGINLRGIAVSCIHERFAAYLAQDHWRDIPGKHLDGFPFRFHLILRDHSQL